MPFTSNAQRKLCYLKDDPKWDCGEWEAHTHGKLPEHKKKKVKGFKEWLQENHAEALDEGWFGKMVAPLAVAGGLMGGMAQGATAPEAGNYTTLQKQDTSRFYPYSWHSGKPGQPGVEKPDFNAALKNYKTHGKTFLKPDHDKIFMQQHLK